MSADSLLASATAPLPKPKSTRWKGFHYLIPILLLLGLFFVIPVLGLLLRSVLEPSLGLENYKELFGSLTYAKVFYNTFLVATVVTLVTILFGFPVAWLMSMMPARWSGLVFGILILSMWTNLLARTYAWMVLLQQTGFINRILMSIGIIDEPLQLVNNLIGVTIGMTYIMLPFLIMPLHSTFKSIDPSVLRAAAVCGASRWQAFWKILLPLALPGLASGGLMVFVMSLGYFVTPSLLGGTSNMMLAELIAQLVQSLLNWGLAGAAAMVLLVITLGLYAVQLHYFGRDKHGHN